MFPITSERIVPGVRAMWRRVGRRRRLADRGRAVASHGQPPAALAPVGAYTLGAAASRWFGAPAAVTVSSGG
jgi:hypothetical protein